MGEIVVPGLLEPVLGADAEILSTISDVWIYDRLRGSAELVAALSAPEAIFPDEAPADVEPPFVVYSIAAPGPDIRATGSIRVAARPLYLVRAYARTRSYFGALLVAASALDRALHRAPGSQVVVPDSELQGNVEGAWREEEFRQPEKHGEEEWRALGGFYRVFVRPT